jgi:hypothetical protein
MKDGAKEEKLLYLFQKSIQFFALAYSTGRNCFFSIMDFSQIPVSGEVLFVGTLGA